MIIVGIQPKQIYLGDGLCGGSRRRIRDQGFYQRPVEKLRTANPNPLFSVGGMEQGFSRRLIVRLWALTCQGLRQVRCIDTVEGAW